MRANKAKGTGPELTLRKALRRSGVIGATFNPKNIPGRPDILYRDDRLAIFINGCFWHRCPYCKYGLPKSNRIFWKKKFEMNKSRDIRKARELRKLGYSVMTVWECQIDRNLNAQIQRVIKRKGINGNEK
ncbi:MAG: very short patch repair endonuclease [Bacteroidetes bacterium]|nr:very short patch repair endonuclease [Bacteroidota bacterium]